MNATRSEPVVHWREHLKALSQDEVVPWLGDVLRGRISLPQGTPDESRNATLLNIEGTLPSRVRDDLRDACLALLGPLLADDDSDDTYAAALLAVCHRLQPAELSAKLAAHTETATWLLHQPERQQHVLAGLLFDLRVPVGPAFWPTLGEARPAQLGLLSLSALLREDAGQAWDLVQRLPNDANVADLLYVVVMGELEARSESERTALRHDWASSSSRVAPTAQLASAVNDAFAAFATSPLAAVLPFCPMSARLQPVAAEEVEVAA